jgi:hypothetical protein
VVEALSGMTTTDRLPVFLSSNDVRLGSVLRVSCTPSVSDSVGSGTVERAQSVAGLFAPWVRGRTSDGVGCGTDGVPAPCEAEQPARTADARSAAQSMIGRPRTATMTP